MSSRASLERTSKENSSINHFQWLPFNIQFKFIHSYHLLFFLKTNIIFYIMCSFRLSVSHSTFLHSYSISLPSLSIFLHLFLPVLSLLSLSSITNVSLSMTLSLFCFFFSGLQPFSSHANLCMESLLLLDRKFLDLNAFSPTAALSKPNKSFVSWQILE